ncbi:unnamed protein product [Caenorhabditis sp. 36 PRJEB53466]|nr:unnamed protein product [Caenorhabditis sp. 36 PRJEB53466]
MPVRVAGKAILDLGYLHTRVNTEELFAGDNPKIYSELERTLNASEQYLNDSDTVIFATATLKRILIIFQTAKQPLPIRYWNKIVLHIKRVWDYSADCACYDAVETFTSLLALHLGSCNECLERAPIDSHANSAQDPKLIKTRVIPMLQKYQSSDSVGKKKTNDSKQSDTAVKFLNQLLNQLNGQQPASDLQLHLEIVHALVTTTWPRKPEKRGEHLNLVDFSHWTQCLSETLMSNAIFHVDSEVRLSAFRLLVENPRKTLIFNETDIEFIKAFLDSNMTFQTPSARHSLISAFKCMCQRLGASAENYLKSVQTSDRDSDSFSPDSSTFDYDNRAISKWKLGGDTNIHPVPDSYFQLTKWMAKLAFESLSSKGSYFRRIMALMQIDVLYTKESFIIDGKKLFADKLNLDSTLGSDRHTLVVDCLDDSYEIVQSTALSMLKKLDFGNVKLDEEICLSEAMKLMNSTRSRSSLSAGYRIRYYLAKNPERYEAFLERFITDLKYRVDATTKDLINITKLPLHPILNILELLLKNPSWEKTALEKISFYRTSILDNILPICHQIVSVVTPVVYNMSPEGCIPLEISESLCNESATALTEISQHLLVCCWRAHKHVSGMFSWIIEALAPLSLVTRDEVEAIGLYYWTQLTECKHRGAFESATDGFTHLCQFLWTTSIEGLPDPNIWLDDVLSAISGEKDLKNLCSTRRKPKEKRNSALKKAVDSLMNRQGKTSEYMIHSMNVMKTIIQNAALHERAVFCYERTLFVAIDSCRAEWSERNAASQLFAALLTKIFGVTRTAQKTLSVDPKNRKSNYEFFSKFPSLYSYLYNQLLIERSEFSLLPPLILLTHLYTPASSTELYPLRPFVPPLLEIALREKRETLRSHAVAAILAISDIYSKGDLCKWIEKFDYKNARQNHIHSFLMLIEGLGHIAEYVERIANVVEKIVRKYAFKKWNDYNMNQILTIANAFGIKFDVEDVPLSTICLTKRPVAVKLLQDRDVFRTEMGDPLKDAEVRREVFRIISKHGWEACTMYLRACIITLAINDLNVEPDSQQCDAKIMLEILSSGREFMSEVNSKNLKNLIEKRLEDPNLNWTLPSTMAYALKVKYATANADLELINWIRECCELDDIETKEIALDVGGLFVLRLPMKKSYTELEKYLIHAVSLYLQDESEFLRQRTAFYLSHLIKSSCQGAINPAICRLLIIKWCLNEGDENLADYICEKKHVEETDDLFDACALNQFAEYAFFGDIRMYESSLGVGEVNSEMYDIEF